MTMQKHWEEPEIVQWCQYLLDSYAYWLKQELIHRNDTPLEQAQRLFNSSFCVASQGLENNPILNYGNQTALNLWAMEWQQFIQTPSRITTESIYREERTRMLEQAKTKGYSTDYRGVRISSSGTRFLIDQAVIWNICKSDGTMIGQGATFSIWKYLS